ncbi:MAG: Uma2 family endonuclease [Ardenticatenales bacterium]|nr:Uma2 family endonuclease [Ardenticatenales bacterium]
MSSQPKSYLTAEDYLALERQADYRSEYYRGEIFAMVGASREHNLISLNIAASFHRQLAEHPCEVYTNDMRVRVSPTGLYTYPDVIVVCGKPQFGDEQNDTLLNPTVLVEVLSESTEAYDRGKKFEHYRTLSSLSDYLLVTQDAYHVEHFARLADGQWLLSEAKGRESSLRIASIACDLALDAVYHKVEIP